MWPVADLREFLAGSWQVDRSVLDRRQSIQGNLNGQAHFAAVGSCLLYEERGTLAFGAHCGVAEQSYKYDFGGGNRRACVSFRDGRAFHDLELSDGQTLVSHLCGPDLYEGRFIALDPSQWQSAWTVTGPRKDLEIFTLYSRLC